MNKKNCWEFTNCGREAGGEKVAEMGSCPAAEEKSLDGINDGVNGGRICWAVTGTLCDGETQGTFAKKKSTCVTCEFYKIVSGETPEDSFVFSPVDMK